ncbi:MAG: hypothetical protein ACRCUY_06035, partial [Thermoguttaceae bacterium]
MRTFDESLALLAEENRKFSAELREFKEEMYQIQKKNSEENRIGFAELRQSQRRNENLFNTQWGRLVEALVNNQVIPLLQSRNILVQRTAQGSKGMTPDKRNYEFDIIAINGDTIVVIEVK